MKRKYKPFKQKIYVTRPLLPDLKNYQNRLDKIWNSQWLTNFGKQHLELENKIKNYLKVPHTSLVSSGTMGLLLTLKALDIKGEVITTPFTFAATSNVLLWCGIKPIFCDINSSDMTIDVQKIENLITPKTTAILGVHVYGNPCDVYEIKKIAQKHNLKVIYDAAHAFGTEINGIGIGNFGDATVFSFHATKLFHTIEGGCVSTRFKKTNKKINLLRNFGILNEEEVVLPGINGKLNEFQAAMGLETFKLLKEERLKREKISKIYINKLGSNPEIGRAHV